LTVLNAIVDAASMRPTDAPIEHRSVCAFAVRLESGYAGVGGSKYGCKWAIDEVCLISGPVRSSAAVAPIDWSTVQIPLWAQV
jgi:hypothetical protein